MKAVFTFTKGMTDVYTSYAPAAPTASRTVS
jgi:hypothetical protein